jgi:hypothetical protein
MQQQFFASVAGMCAAATVQHAETLVSREKTSCTYAEGGEFLPLKVWETRGLQRRKQHCTQVKNRDLARSLLLRRAGLCQALSAEHPNVVQ